jgi:Tol biopolymer transport system component
VNVASGEKRVVTKEDAAQPNWSPHGQRIAYWGVHRGGQRDIWTIPASGAEPVSVTDDAAVDWSPVWSPDGNYLYFASDRGGSMNLWRVAIDESSGKVLGSPEPITTPSVYSGDISFSSNGRRLAYVQTVTRNNLQEVSFDPQREKIVGTSRSITQGSKLATNPNLSPDGEQFVFDAVGDKQEDLFVVKRDGTGLRQLTNDAYKDRAPFWSPDGRKIVFFSDRSGRYESWTINPDGSGLQQLTYTTERDTQLTIWSPDGTRVLCNLQFGAPIILESGKTWQEQTPKTLSLGNDPDQFRRLV